MSASAVSHNKRNALKLKPLPRNIVNRILPNVGEDSSAHFLTDNVLPNTPQYEKKRSISPGKNTFSGLKIRESMIPPKQSSRTPPKSPKTAVAVVQPPPHHLLPPPKYINPNFELPKAWIFTREQERKRDLNYSTIKRLNEIVDAYCNLIVKFKNNQNINIFSFIKILNKILVKTSIFAKYLPGLAIMVDYSKKLIKYYIEYIIKNYSEYTEQYKEFDKFVYHDKRERDSNYEELLLQISKDAIFQFNIEWTIYVYEEGKGRVQKKLNTTEIYNEMFYIMYDIFYYLNHILSLEHTDNILKLYSSDILRYSENRSEWLERNRGFIMSYIPTTHSIDSRYINKLSVSSISDTLTKIVRFKFLPVIFYDIKDKKLIIDRLDNINTKIYELKYVLSNVSPILQIMNLLILIKGLLRMNSYTIREGTRYLINSSMKRDIRIRIREFEQKLKNKDHIIGMRMHDMMPTKEIEKLNLVKELDNIVYSMNDYYGRKGLFFRANQVRKFFTRRKEAPGFAQFIHEVNAINHEIRDKKNKKNNSVYPI